MKLGWGLVLGYGLRLGLGLGSHEPRRVGLSVLNARVLGGSPDGLIHAEIARLHLQHQALVPVFKQGGYDLISVG